MTRNLYRAAFAVMVAALAVACSPGDKPAVSVDVTVKATLGAEATLESALQADREFAAATLKDGPKAAFAAWMDPDVDFIEPGIITKGADKVVAGFDQSPPDFTIDWTPDGGHASAGGDFAATTGRYTVKMGAGVLAVGRYLTVWRKDTAGAWKVVMDTTIADPVVAPTTPDPEGRPG